MISTTSFKSSNKHYLQSLELMCEIARLHGPLLTVAHSISFVRTVAPPAMNGASRPIAAGWVLFLNDSYIENSGRLWLAPHLCRVHAASREARHSKPDGCRKSSFEAEPNPLEGAKFVSRTR
jgi:hypothetical protein